MSSIFRPRKLNVVLFSFYWILFGSVYMFAINNIIDGPGNSGADGAVVLLFWSFFGFHWVFLLEPVFKGLAFWASTVINSVLIYVIANAIDMVFESQKQR